MSKLKNAMMENTEDDMAVEHDLSSHGKLIAELMTRSEMAVKDAWVIGWSLHDIDASIDRLALYEPTDLSAVTADLDMIIAKLTKLSERIGK